MEKLSKILFASLIVAPLSVFAASPIKTLNGLNATNQFLATLSDAHIAISSVNDTHTFSWAGVLQPAQGGLGASSFSTGSVLFFNNGKVSEDNANFSFSSSTKTLTLKNLVLLNPLSAVSGGTGNTGYAAGDILVAQDSNMLVRLPVGQDGEVLMANSFAPFGVAWVTPAFPLGNELESNSLRNNGNLVSYYRMEGNASDEKGNNNGIETSMSYSMNNGRFNQGGRFSANGYVSIGSNSFSTGNADRGFYFWVRPGLLTANDQNGVVGYGAESVGAATAGKLSYATIYGNDGTYGSPYFFANQWDAISTIRLPLNQWAGVVVVYSAGKTTFYVRTQSGFQSETVDNGGNAGALSTNAGTNGYIGKDGIGRKFIGSLDDVAIFNRALTAAEAQSLLSAP